MGQQPTSAEPEKTLKDQIRDQKRNVNRSRRGLTREKNRIEHDKKKMMSELKKLALNGQHQAAKLLARDIVRATTQTNKGEQFIGQLNAVSLKGTSVTSGNEGSDAMEQVSSAMQLVSSKLDTVKGNKMAHVMAKEDYKLDMKQDMIGDVGNELGESNDNPEEEEKIYRNILEEVGLKVDEIGPGVDKENCSDNINVSKKDINIKKDDEEDSLDAMLKSGQK